MSIVAPLLVGILVGTAVLALNEGELTRRRIALLCVSAGSLSIAMWVLVAATH